MPKPFLVPLAFAAALASAGASAAQDVPTSQAQINLSFAPVVRKAAPAVVNVYAKVLRQTVNPFFQMFGGYGPTEERMARSLGSGVIVRPDGVIVTNNHVIAGGQDIMVALGDRREFPAKVLYVDSKADVAVLKIDVGGEQLPVMPLAQADESQVGDLVLAIGDPFGVGQTVTNGIVSAVARSDVGVTSVPYFIQTDAPINPGNSGGALVNMSGEMIGMNTAILSGTGTSAGIGFAIPAPLVRHIVQQALAGGAATERAWLGLKTQGVSAAIAKTLGLPRPEGALVTDVWPGGPGERAGIRSGDLILSLDGHPIDDDAALNYRIATLDAGQDVAVAYRRGNGAEQTARLRLSPLPAEPARDEQTIDGHNPLQGATVENLSPAVADQMGLDPFAASHGVMITKIAGGFAAGYFQPGDLVREVNGHAVASVSDLKAALTTGASGVWRLVIVRGNQVMTGQFSI
ncbi:MAG TPA: trypsin-like peptidase domain-containing protein [Caulobacteraceae bacterium]|nr:trypsin-like peptidase domain-containing protein [Caulobacteraceae bacterium]